jgi:hypothetical protein
MLYIVQTRPLPTRDQSLDSMSVKPACRFNEYKKMKEAERFNKYKKMKESRIAI